MKLFYFILLFYLSINAQEERKFGWKELANKNGLFVEFLFYSEADNTNNGVVVKLENKNNYRIHYAFDLIFRSADADTTQFVTGIMLNNQVKTGSNDNLFWVPFKDGRFIGEVGLTNFKVSERSE